MSLLLCIRTCSGWRGRPLQLQTIAGQMVTRLRLQSRPSPICVAACELLQTPHSFLRFVRPTLAIVSSVIVAMPVHLLDI